MSGVFNLHFIGRFGNQMFEYAFARGYCEMHGIELHTDPWAGEQIFELSHPRCYDAFPPRDENTLQIGKRNVSYRSYSQRQHCADYYSLRQIREWFQFRPEVCAALSTPGRDDVIAHVRRGDYAGSGYPLVSRESYLKDFPFGINWVSEDNPATHPYFTGELSFVPDFFWMSNAYTLLRANSSFSFWAACLAMVHNRARVYSPVITGKAGGVLHDCEFQPDNWARIAELDCVDQITIKP